MIRPARTAREPTDVEVNAVIDLHPDGAPLPVMPDLLGTTDERARQILLIALGKALATARSRGLMAADFID